MRRFLVVGHKAKGEGDFNLDDLPGSGRMDIIAISASTALFLSHSIRKDVEVWLLFLGDEGRLMRIIGSEAKYLFPDERNMAAAIRNALIRHKKGKKMMPGIYVDDVDFAGSVEMASRDSTIYYLKEDGIGLSKLEISSDSTFILGDHMDLSREEEDLLDKYSCMRVSLGKKSLHTYQAINIVNYELDRREKDDPGDP